MSIFQNSNEHVGRSSEFLRISSLHRQSFTPEQLEHIRLEMTAALRRPGGKMSLRTHQALALHEIGLHNGACCIMRVGSGKTIVALLAAAVVHPEPKRPLIVTKAALVSQMKDNREELKTEWLLPHGVDTVSYEILGRESGSDYLEKEKQPDFIILDEAHLAKNLKAGVVKRLVRYMNANPATRVVDLSGTFFKASLKDAAHRITWVLKGGAPVPSGKDEVDLWARALDVDHKVGQRVQPGALMDFVSAEDWQPREPGQVVTQTMAARRGFQRRLVETPGVVATGGDQVDCSLNIIGREFTPNTATDANFVKLRKEWQTPDEWELTQAIEVWACARQLALGLHLIWHPRPPEEWSNRRKAWGKFVRETLKRTKRVRYKTESGYEEKVLDTPGQVATAARAGLLNDDGLYAAWEKVEPSYIPRTKAIWHDDTALKLCVDWSKKNNGLIWTEHTAFARELASLAGIPYYGRDGIDDQGNSITPVAKDVLEGKRKPHPIICSMKANATGRNLQGWSENLITSIPTEAALWEQLLGRTHRDGQKADEVNVHTLFSCWEHLDGFEKAVELARAIQDTEGSSQKLLIATRVVPPVAFKTGLRWQKTTDEDESSES